MILDFALATKDEWTDLIVDYKRVSFNSWQCDKRISPKFNVIQHKLPAGKNTRFCNSTNTHHYFVKSCNLRNKTTQNNVKQCKYCENYFQIYNQGCLPVRFSETDDLCLYIVMMILQCPPKAYPVVVTFCLAVGTFPRRHYTERKLSP